MWRKILAVVLGVVVGYWFIDDFNPDVLRGKRVLVTGASTGIGEQMAYVYAKLGASVVVTARRESRLREVVARCRQEGNQDGQYYYIVADMSDLDSTGRVVKEAVDRLGGLDYLVLNHIIMTDLGMWEGSPSNLTLLEKVLGVNFYSYVHLAAHALPHLNASRGSLVVVSSMAGKLSLPFGAEYSASKFALQGFFGSVRQEMKVRSCDISITLCILGFIGTENTISQLRKYGQNYMVDYVPQARPADAALAIVKGGASRTREVYFPYMQVRPLILLRDWFPRLADYIILSSYSFQS